MDILTNPGQIPLNLEYPLVRAHAIVAKSRIREAMEEVLGEHLKDVTTVIQSEVGGITAAAPASAPGVDATRLDRMKNDLIDEVKKHINALNAYNASTPDQQLQKTKDDLTEALSNLKTAEANLDAANEDIENIKGFGEAALHGPQEDYDAFLKKLEDSARHPEYIKMVKEGVSEIARLRAQLATLTPNKETEALKIALQAAQERAAKHINEYAAKIRELALLQAQYDENQRRLEETTAKLERLEQTPEIIKDQKIIDKLEKDRFFYEVLSENYKFNRWLSNSAVFAAKKEVQDAEKVNLRIETMLMCIKDSAGFTKELENLKDKVAKHLLHITEVEKLIVEFQNNLDDRAKSWKDGDYSPDSVDALLDYMKGATETIVENEKILRTSVSEREELLSSSRSLEGRVKEKMIKPGTVASDPSFLDRIMGAVQGTNGAASDGAFNGETDSGDTSVPPGGARETFISRQNNNARGVTAKPVPPRETFISQFVDNLTSNNNAGGVEESKASDPQGQLIYQRTASTVKAPTKSERKVRKINSGSPLSRASSPRASGSVPDQTYIDAMKTTIRKLRDGDIEIYNDPLDSLLDKYLVELMANDLDVNKAKRIERENILRQILDGGSNSREERAFKLVPKFKIGYPEGAELEEESFFLSKTRTYNRYKELIPIVKNIQSHEEKVRLFLLVVHHEGLTTDDGTVFIQPESKRNIGWSDGFDLSKLFIWM